MPLIPQALGGNSAAPELMEPATAVSPINYFDSAAVAERYSCARPSQHALVLQMIRATVGHELPVESALDVGCGTGDSTVALLPYARHIVGLDASSEMLAQAERRPNIEYRKGWAESLPFRTGSFDLVTVSSAYHWFDHERFLRQAARVLRRDRWLVLYKAGTVGRPVGQPGFDAWRKSVFNERFPRVARNDAPLTAERAAMFGFQEVHSQSAVHYERHAIADYVENLLTHSRVIRAIDHGNESVDAVRAWLHTELAPYFPKGEALLAHDHHVHVLERFD